MLDNIKNMRGALFKKFKKTAKKKEEISLPAFSINATKRLVEFPAFDDQTKINITYPLIEPFAYANIKWDDAQNKLIYNIIEPKIDEKDAELILKISDALMELIDVKLTGIKDNEKLVSYLEEQVTNVLKEFGIDIGPNQYIKIMYYIYRNFVGFNKIETFLHDPNIEDISCDGVKTHIYIVHRKYGSLKTNVIFNDIDMLKDFVIKLSERSGRYVSYAEPILNGTLPDGSRVSATLAGDVATRGPTFTIRKFGERPLSPVEEIDLKAMSADILAYLWYIIEHRASLLIIGGTATGKTSLLNSICMFIQPEAKIVSIEDTREIRIPHEHWIPGLARTGFGIPTSTGEKYGEVSMFSLLKESFRQNPDYVIVGETRGLETYVMFQGMSSGHSSLSTFHAGNVDTLIKRLITPPIELAPSLLESLDVIIVMIHAKERGKSARRAREVVEIGSVDPDTGEVKTNVIFRWNPNLDEFEKVNDSMKLERIVGEIGSNINDAIEDIERRKKVLLWMKDKGTKDYLEVTKIINQYYKDPEGLMSEIGEKFVAPAKTPIAVKIRTPQKTTPEKQRRGSILDLLGFKIIKEK